MSAPRVDQLQNQAFDSLKQGQEAVTSLATAVSENWAAALRSGSGAGSPGLPGLHGLPRPEDVVDRTFDVAVQALEAQRAFAHTLVDLAAPVLRATEAVADSTTERARGH